MSRSVSGLPTMEAGGVNPHQGWDDATAFLISKPQLFV